MFITKRFTLLLFLFSNSSVAALQGNFWLPSSYSALMPVLEQAVLEAESTPKCQKVISGSISEQRSTLSSPVFKLVCRNEAGATYPLIYNAISGQLIDLDAETKKQQTQLSKVDELATISKSWKRCANEFRERTNKMKGVKVTDEYNQLPNVVKNGLAKFLIDFNVAGPYGLVRKQRAICEVDYESEAVHMNISVR